MQGFLGLEAPKAKAKTTAAEKNTSASQVPTYQVDPFWPQPLPNKWSMQQVVDLFIDRHNDHIWMINRAGDARPDELSASTQPARSECCVLGPEIIELDPEGRVVRGWGGKDYVPGWPTHLQSMAVDREGNVWISGTDLGDSIQNCIGSLTPGNQAQIGPPMVEKTLHIQRHIHRQILVIGTRWQAAVEQAGRGHRARGDQHIDAFGQNTVDNRQDGDGFADTRSMHPDQRPFRAAHRRASPPFGPAHDVFLALAHAVTQQAIDEQAADRGRKAV
jgi:hypothetical protein